MRPQRLKARPLAWAVNYRQPVFVCPASVLGGRAGDEFARGGDGARDVRRGRRWNVDHARDPSMGEPTEPYSVDNSPFSS
jgi:hypothetical protein